MVLILVGVGFWYYQNYQKDLVFCMDRCSYVPPREGVANTGGFTGLAKAQDRGDYWLIEGGKKFENQKECINYCLNFK